MATQKLNKEIRRIIVRAAVEHRFAEEEKALIEEGTKLLKETALAAQIEGEYPSGWFKKTDSIQIYIPSIDLPLETRWIHGEAITKLEKTWRPIAYLGRSILLPYEHRDYVTVPRPSETWDKYENLDKRIRTLLELREETRKKMSCIINRFGTVSALLSSWPELEPFIPKSEEAQLPALPIYEMNKMLGLPVEGREPVSNE